MSGTTLLLPVGKTLFLAYARTFYWMAFLLLWTSKSFLFYWSQSRLFLEISWLKAMMAILWMLRRFFIWEIDTLRLLRYISFAFIRTWVFDRRLWKYNPWVLFYVRGLLRRERRLTFFFKLDRSSLGGSWNLWFFWLYNIFCFCNCLFELLSNYLFLLKLLNNDFRLGFHFLSLLRNLSLYLVFQLMLERDLCLLRRLSNLSFDLSFFLGDTFFDNMVRFNWRCLIEVLIWSYLSLWFRIILFIFNLYWRSFYFLSTIYLWLALLSNFVCTAFKFNDRFLFRQRLSSSWLF